MSLEPSMFYTGERRIILEVGDNYTMCWTKTPTSSCNDISVFISRDQNGAQSIFEFTLGRVHDVQPQYKSRMNFTCQPDTICVNILNISVDDRGFYWYGDGNGNLRITDTFLEGKYSNKIFDTTGT